MTFTQPPSPNEIRRLSEGLDNQPEGQWPDRHYSRVERAELYSFHAAGTPRGQALVYAGGGYVQLVTDKEGVEVARWLNDLGLDAHVLLHRLPGQPCRLGDEAVHPADIALQDGLAALRVLALSERAASLPLLHVGISSGGHLAGVMACQAHPAPLAVRGALMAYAPLNANHRRYKSPPGKPDYPPPEKQAFYDAWPIGITTEPHGLPPVPLFLAYALHDPIVPVEHAMNLLLAARDHRLDVEAHVWASAEHGFALRALQGTHDQWPLLAARWIDRCLHDATV
ncbi:alpha/beta hydrolase [Solimonas marina]|uniref:Pectin acetylesterase n=1 Tax=Solimonas marina TaxID=2714601 RepID=A0A970B8W1_9GAMM|nr:pectin acetylesterase [Solimonas marina]NKF22674.1 pectin acetylesterase [Solimonas marina]